MRFWLAILLTLCVLGPAEAWAQSITINNVERSGSGHGNAFPFHISRSDCESSEIFTFPATIDFTGADRVEVWSSEGADCTLYDERFGENAQCAELTVDIANKTPQDIEIPSSEIANSLLQVDGCIDASGASSGRSISLYFLMVSGSTDAVGFAFNQITVDLVGPDPPSDISAGPGEQAIIASYSIDDIDDDRRKFVMFCDAGTAVGTGGAGGSGGAAVGGAGAGGVGNGAGGAGGLGGGGGVAGSGGAGGVAAGGGGRGGSGGEGATTPAECGSGLLVRGEVPPSNAVQCGEASGAEITATGLENFTTYAVAIAAVDDLDNFGPLSEVICATPEPVNDFFKLYQEAGGEAGGGICSAGGTLGRAPAGGIAGAGFVALAAVGLLRRRKRSRR